MYSRSLPLSAATVLMMLSAAAAPLAADQTGTTTGGPDPLQAPLAFEHVTVIDVATGNLLPAHTVLVTGNRITALGPAGKVRVPKGARVIDAKDKYLIPGLWDMHAHTDMTGSNGVASGAMRAPGVYPLFIAYGVTGLREMAQRLFTGAIDSFYVWQREIMAGRLVGPRVVGPSIDLTAPEKVPIRLTVENAAPLMDSLKAAGIAFFKYHDDTNDAALFFAAAREARRLGIPLVGHVPGSVSNVEAADSGLRSIEHTNETQPCFPASAWDNLLEDSSVVVDRCAPVVQAYLRNGTWLTPTRAAYYYDAIEPSRIWRRRFLPKVRLDNGRRVVQAMYQLGFRRFLAGTDTPAYGTRPGFPLLQELSLFVEAGLTSLEALQTATLNPAQFFGATDSLGTVAAGKLADLVLLDANPLADIRNVWKIRAVVANGRYFDRTALDAMDPTGVAMAAEWQRKADALVGKPYPWPVPSATGTSTPTP